MARSPRRDLEPQQYTLIFIGFSELVSDLKKILIALATGQALGCRSSPALRLQTPRLMKNCDCLTGGTSPVESPASLTTRYLYLLISRLYREHSILGKNQTLHNHAFSCVFQSTVNAIL